MGEQQASLPLIVVCFKQLLTLEQRQAAMNKLNNHLNQYGWAAIVVDGMEKSGVVAYMPSKESESISIEEMQSLLLKSIEQDDPHRGA